MKVAFGSDPFGCELKEELMKYVQELGYEVEDYGCQQDEKADYPDIAYAVAMAIKEKKADRGILICGTGVGMAITANKVPGIRASQCPDIVTAFRSRNNNDAQIMTLGAWITGVDAARMLVKIFLETEYAGGPTVPRLAKIAAIEAKLLGKCCH